MAEVYPAGTAKHLQRDHLLHDFEPPHTETRLLKPDAVARHLRHRVLFGGKALNRVQQLSAKPG
jgi:hypothetical protein